MRSREIINLARSFKQQWHTNDPYTIADHLGIVIMKRDAVIKDFTAQTVKVTGYPTIISINNAYTDFSQKLLCAHELGHALLHENCVNHFATTSLNVKTTVEQEANLFAIALLTDESFDRELDMPLEKMNNYVLKTIMEFNLKKKA